LRCALARERSAIPNEPLIFTHRRWRAGMSGWIQVLGFDFGSGQLARTLALSFALRG